MALSRNKSLDGNTVILIPLTSTFQVSEVHTAYQVCSQQKGDAALSELQDEKDKRIVDVRKEKPGWTDEIQNCRDSRISLLIKWVQWAVVSLKTYGDQKVVTLLLIVILFQANLGFITWDAFITSGMSGHMEQIQNHKRCNVALFSCTFPRVRPKRKFQY